MVERVINNPLTIRLMEILEAGSIECTVGELHEKLKEDGKLKYGLPQTPAHLSGALKRLKPALKKAGINIAFGDKTRDGKFVHIWLEAETDEPAQAHQTLENKMEPF